MQKLKCLYIDLFGDKFANFVSSIVVVLGYIAAKLWGGWDTAMETLLIFMILDYVIGVMGGAARKELSSRISFEGIKKKLVVWVLIAVSYRVDMTIGLDGDIKTVMVLFFIGQEGISIIENAVVLGIPVPEALQNSLIQLQKGQKKDLERVDRD